MKHSSGLIEKKIDNNLSIDWTKWKIEKLRLSLDVELGVGEKAQLTKVTDCNPVLIDKVGLANLDELPDYCKRSEQLEEETEIYWRESEKISLANISYLHF